MRRSNRRGQTLVLMALTMLLLVVMVCMTLAIGMKTRERLELQTLADATAYSNAVATARTYNLIATWNRAQISHMVVLAGAQSHISFASWAMASLRTGAIGAAAQVVPCTAAAVFVPCFAKACVDLGRAAIDLEKEYNDVLKKFQDLDELAGAEAKALQGLASLYGIAGNTIMAAKLLPFHASGGFAEKFLDTAITDPSRRAEYSVNSIANTVVSAREVGPASASGAWNHNSTPYPALPAAHGTRKNDFIRHRNGLAVRPMTVLGKIPGFMTAYSQGDAYWGTSKDKPHESDGRFSFADDQGASFGAVFGSGCPWPFFSYAQAEVKSTDDKEFNDSHTWSLGSPHKKAENKIHDMGDCGEECPSVWVNRAEFNIDPKSVNTHEADQWKQPKVYVALERDYTKRTIEDPWNLMFQFRLQPDDSGANVDLGKKGSGSGGRFKKQAALASAITYYHRHMDPVNSSLYWREPPNFFNPFWRATLVAPDIDNTGTADMTATLGSIDGDFVQAYIGLTTVAGFKGIQ